jgi:ketosteroid isomerase-like protein
MKTVFLCITLLTLVSFGPLQFSESDDKEQINATLEAWHKAAAEAKFDAYFGMMTEDAIFIGTDPTENWNKKAFQAYSKPHFDKGKAWNFKAIERNIYFDESGKLAWFDELLSTQMKICRGSGVLVKIGKEWKIKHYVLSITIPNDNTNEVVKIIAPIEDALMLKMQNK